MATGTTPTGTVRTGATGRAPQPQRSPFDKVGQLWGSLPPRSRTFIMIGAMVLFFVFAIFFNVKHANAPISLFDTPITSDDVNQIGVELNRMGIPYTINETGNNILIAPQLRPKAKMELAMKGLPRRPVITTGTPAANGGSPRSSEELNQQRLQQLEGDITMIIRQLDGVSDAYVKIVVPKEKFFEDEQEPAKAAIMLKLQPGYENISAEAIKGITQVVANSVPQLKPENVEIVDTNGRVLSHRPEEKGMSMQTGDPTRRSTQWDQQQQVEKRLEQKAQEMLDQVLGPGRSVVKVSAELNWDQSKITKEDFGGPANLKGEVTIGRHYESEDYRESSTKRSSGGGQQISMAGTTKKPKGEYHKEKVVENKKVNTTKTETLTAPGAIKMLSVAVTVDDFIKEDQRRAIQATVKRAVGFNEARGDSIAVAVTPFEKGVMDLMAQDMRSRGSAPPAYRSAAPPFNTDWMVKVAAIPFALLIVVMAVFLFRQKRAEQDKASLVLAAGSPATVNDISDLLSDKGGRTTPPAVHRNTTEQLEKLAKEKPTKVAELLKTTWLAEK